METKHFKILAIDDTMDNLLVLKALVNEFYPNAVFLGANTGKQGLDLSLKEQPDLILLDIIMPDMDGFQVCKAIKKNPITQSIPVIMITAAKTGMESKVRSLESGADAFLTKPIDEVELKAQIGAMLRMKEAIDYKNNEKSLLEKLVLERTSMLEKELSERKLTEEKLQIAIKNLEASKEAALNLMEDLQDEILENQKNQKTLQESEERFRLVFENSPVGIL
ncbi:MAG: response regulator, partial [Ignavibacteria bacterium]|nr:response regulator [Ignavibacteria bacterium]